MSKVNLFWFRRDLRIVDNRGLYEAFKAGLPVQCIFIFDENILDQLEDKDDARVEFIHYELAEIKSTIEANGGTLDARYGKPVEVWKDLLATYEVDAVYTNEDFEPYAKERDEKVQALLEKKKVSFHKSLDHLIFPPDKVLKDDGNPYVVFTPYSRKWRAALFPADEVKKSDPTTKDYSGSKKFDGFPSEGHFDKFHQCDKKSMPSLNDMGFKKSSIDIPSSRIIKDIIKTYDETRDFPAKSGTSKLGIHLRFGTISIRKLGRIAAKLNATYLNELIWREFYAQILHQFPHVVKGPFREKYARIEWRNNESEFKAWCEGKTGYPMVDAGMRQLNKTGYMHNRVRMVVASFLTKHLLINWQWGEAYFARLLLDFELASNSGGWQWAAGCGTDAAPYFRIFNPESQMKKFDPKKIYIKEWIEEYGTDDYPAPIVDHKEARERCLQVYKSALDGQ